MREARRRLPRIVVEDGGHRGISPEFLPRVRAASTRQANTTLAGAGNLRIRYRDRALVEGSTAAR
jgi:hypothetical protein